MVVVGGTVVVVVGGTVVGVVVVGVLVMGVAPAAAAGVVAVVGGVVVGGVVVVGGWCLWSTVVGAVVVGLGAVEVADPPGCSLATVTPMNAATPPATRTAVLVSRLMRACARAWRSVSTDPGCAFDHRSPGDFCARAGSFETSTTSTSVRSQPEEPVNVGRVQAGTRSP